MNSPFAAGAPLRIAGVFARGMCIGAADLVPGVSGGTVALVVGIYERLLSAIAAATDAQTIRDALALRFAAAWRRIDGGFLAALGAGIVCAIFSLGGLLHHMLETRAHLLLAFFCGLVLAAAAATARRLRAPAMRHWAAFGGGAMLGLAAAAAPAAAVEPSSAALFFGGAIAVCAMILPGISGGYVLLIAGLYAPIIEALHSRDWATLLIFAAGCACGLPAFARLLRFLLRRFHDGMHALLIGAMIGATPKLWPWKEQGEGAKIILQPNVQPSAFAGDAQIGAAAALALGGALLVFALHAAGRRTSA